MAISKCCKCISLEKESLILGILSCLGWSILLILSVIITIRLDNDSTDNKVAAEELSIDRATTVEFLTYSIIRVIISIVFIIGIKMKNKKFILPYLALTFAELIRTIPRIIYLTFFVSFIGIPGRLVFLTFNIGLLCFALEGYFWQVCYDHYMTMDNEGHGPTAPHGLI